MQIVSVNPFPIKRTPYVDKNKNFPVLFGNIGVNDVFEKSALSIEEQRIKQAKLELIKQAKFLADRNLTAGSGGNISMRIDDKILISKAGSMFYHLTEEQISLIDSAGKLISGERPSSETPLHLAIYKNRPDVNSVIHFHPVYATVYAVANKTMLPNILPHTTKHFHDLKVIPYENAGSEELACKTAQKLGNSEAILLGNHGALVVGATPQIAAKTADSLENYAHISYLIQNSIFRPHFLTKENVDYMINSSNNK